MQAFLACRSTMTGPCVTVTNHCFSDSRAVTAQPLVHLTETMISRLRIEDREAALLVVEQMLPTWLEPEY